MGLITNLIQLKQDQTAKATDTTVGALKSIISDPKATPEYREWANNHLRDFINIQLGGSGAGGGSTGGKGQGKGGQKQGIGDIFHSILGRMIQVNPYTPGQGIKNERAAMRSDMPKGPVDMSDEQYQEKQKKDALNAEAIKQAVAESYRKAEFKAINERADELKAQFLKTGMQPIQAEQQAREQAEFEITNKTPPRPPTSPTDKPPAAGKQTTIVGPDGKEFIGIERNDATGTPQLYKIGSNEPLDTSKYSAKNKEPQDVTSLRGLEEDLKALHPDWTPEQIKAEAAKQDLEARKNQQQKVKVEISNAAAQQNTPISNNTVRTLAEQYVDSGGKITPPLNYRGRDKRDFDDAVAAIINERKAAGNDVSLVETRVRQDAARQAIDVLAKTQATLSGQEKGTVAEIDRAKLLAKKIPNTAFKRFNSIGQFLDANLSDDPDLARFREALVSVRQRYSAMVSNLRGAGTSTNAVRAETAEEILDRTLPPQALQGALDEMKTGIGNITKGVGDALKEQQSAFKGTTGKGDATPTVSTQAQYDALPSGAIYLEDGKKFKKP